MRTFLCLLLVSAALGQQCIPGDELGPCGTGNTCDPNQTPAICIGGVCCPLGSIFTTTTTTTTTTTMKSNSCVDKINPQTGTSDCPNVKYLCNDPTYKTVMADQCPLTCGLCGANPGNPGNTVCQDKINPQTGRSDCPSVAYLCNDATYKPLMADQCPKTCGYCH